jgi:hypothetical protein
VVQPSPYRWPAGTIASQVDRQIVLQSSGSSNSARTARDIRSSPKLIEPFIPV